MPTLPVAARGGKTADSWGGYPAFRTSSNQGVVFASDFGISPSNDDNAAGLVALRSFLRDNISTPWRVIFGDGVFKYSDNTFINGVGSVEYVGAQSTYWQCTSANPFDVNKNALAQNVPFYVNNMDTLFGVSTVYTNGDRINSASAGAMQIVMQGTPTAANYAAGARVLIYGFDQQGDGFPPNPRYFQYARVVAYDAGTKTITLDVPLRDDQRADWRDLSYANMTYGAARVISLDRPGDFVMSHNLVFRNIKFLKNPTGGAHTFIVSAWRVELDSCDGSDNSLYFSPSICREAIARNCRFGNSDIDKCNESVRFIGGSIGRFNGATGTRRLEISGGTVVNETTGASAPFKAWPEVLVMDDVDIFPATAWSTSAFEENGWRVRRMRLNNVRIHNAGRNLREVFQNERSSFVSGTPIGGKIVIPTNSGAEFTQLKQIDIGTLIYTLDGAVRGRVTSILFNGTDHELTGTWSPSALSAGQTLYYNIVQSREINGLTNEGNLNLIKHTTNGCGIESFCGDGRASYRIKDWRWLASSNFRLTPHGQLYRVVISVLKPFTGSGTAQMRIDPQYPTLAQTAIIINLATDRYAESTLTSAYVDPVGSTVQQLKAGEICSGINGSMTFSNGAPSAENAPVVSVEIYFHPAVA